MGRNSWITFGVIAIVIISIVLVALLILVPQGESTIVNVYMFIPHIKSSLGSSVIFQGSKGALR